MNEYAKDIFALVADRDMEQAFTSLLAQHEKLRIRRIRYDIEVHPNHDAGCRADAVEMLRPCINRYKYALVVFDHQGCGSKDSREHVQQEVQKILARNGWENRCKAIVIAPELENWVWAPSGKISEILGWGNDFDALKTWLCKHRLWRRDRPKPIDPKRAMQKALEHKRVKRSSRLFSQIAHVAPLKAESCVDPAFAELRETLQRWFPPENHTDNGLRGVS